MIEARFPLKRISIPVFCNIMKDTSQIDRQLSIRVPLDLHQRIEARAEYRNRLRLEARARGDRAPRGFDLDSKITFSDVVRNGLELAFAVWDDDQDSIRDIAHPVIVAEVERILAQSVDPKKLKAAMARETEPNFG